MQADSRGESLIYDGQGLCEDGICPVRYFLPLFLFFRPETESDANGPFRGNPPASPNGIGGTIPRTEDRYSVSDGFLSAREDKDRESGSVNIRSQVAKVKV